MTYLIFEIKLIMYFYMLSFFTTSST